MKKDRKATPLSICYYGSWCSNCDCFTDIHDFAKEDDIISYTRELSSWSGTLTDTDHTNSIRCHAYVMESGICLRTNTVPLYMEANRQVQNFLSSLSISLHLNSFSTLLTDLVCDLSEMTLSSHELTKSFIQWPPLFGWVDSPYLYSYFNLSTTATFPQWQQCIPTAKITYWQWTVNQHLKNSIFKTPFLKLGQKTWFYNKHLYK